MNFTRKNDKGIRISKRFRSGQRPEGFQLPEPLGVIINRIGNQQTVSQNRKLSA